MTSLTQTFDDRLLEIEAYLDLLEAFDCQLKNGPSKMGGGPITAQQQKILYSAVYLQLYNLVEVTVTRCVDAVRAAASENERWKPADLSKQLREEWASLKAETTIPLNQENRRQRAVALCEHLVKNLPVTWPDDVRTPGGGNWDDDQIEKMSARLGCELQISANATEAVKRPIRDEKGPLKVIRDRRNGLAHGSLSFEECGADVTIKDLRRTKDCAVLYLKEVIAAFSCHIDAYEFLASERRPSVGLAG